MFKKHLDFFLIKSEILINVVLAFKADELKFYVIVWRNKKITY
jgi:hypothetical protein